MKYLFIGFLFFYSLSISGQENSTCSPMVEGKICYTDERGIANCSRTQLFDAINEWAKKNYGKDVFISNVSANRGRGSILVSSKVELLLDDKDVTQLKFKLFITCHDYRYTIEAKDLKYIYDAGFTKKNKTYAAEDVITNQGKSNVIASIEDPELFCKATAYFINGLFKEIHEAAKKAK